MSYKMRDLETNPYSPDEQRVCIFLKTLMGENFIGCGDDPIGFVLASYAQMAYERREKPKADSDTDHIIKQSSTWKIGVTEREDGTWSSVWTQYRRNPNGSQAADS